MHISSIGQLVGRSIKSLASGVVVIALSGCVTADKPSLSPEARQNLRLAAVEVAFTPDASIHVSAVEDEATSRGATTREQVREAEVAHIRQVVTSEFTEVVGPRLAGSRPVVAKIRINNFYIPGAVGALLLDGKSALSAGVDLVDRKSGEVLVSIPPGKIMSGVYRPGGVLGLAVQLTAAGDPADKKTREMSREFAAEYVSWLMRS
jgi:hypothetical protein